MKILHNAEYTLSFLNAVDYRSEKLVLKLFGPFFRPLFGYKERKRHQHCFERHLFSPCCTSLMKKLSLTLKLMTLLRDIGLHGRLRAVQGQMG